VTICQSCGALQGRDAPTFDLADARPDSFGSLHFGGITVHNWGADPDLDWSPESDNPWRYYGIDGEWSAAGYPDAVTAARGAWFDATDHVDAAAGRATEGQP
jgi:hypothetical protein